MDQVCQLIAHKRTLAQFDLHLILREQLEYLSQQQYMPFQCDTMHQNVIDEHENPVAEKRCKHNVHSTLEHAKSPGHPIRHHFELKVAVVCLECSFSFIRWPHPNMVITRSQVQTGEAFGSMQLIKQFIDDQQRVPILYSYRIQVSVIYAEAPFSVLLLNQEN